MNANEHFFHQRHGPAKAISPLVDTLPGVCRRGGNFKLTTMTQPEFTFRPGVTGGDIARLSELLTLHGWLTRQEVGDSLRWTDRKIRDVAESMGSAIVRGQRGFKLVADLERDDLGAAAQAADAALSQGKRMIRYGFALKRKLHAKL